MNGGPEAAFEPISIAGSCLFVLNGHPVTDPKVLTHIPLAVSSLFDFPQLHHFLHYVVRSVRDSPRRVAAQREPSSGKLL